MHDMIMTLKLKTNMLHCFRLLYSLLRLSTANMKYPIIGYSRPTTLNSEHKGKYLSTYLTTEVQNRLRLGVSE